MKITDVPIKPLLSRPPESRCPNCFHIIGEHYLCREHGGPSAWTAGAYKQKPHQVDYPPPEAMEDLSHPWWDFLDVQTREMQLPEAVP